MKKHTLEYVRKYIESEGYILLSDSYSSNREQISVGCSEGHTYNVSFSNFQKGHRCPHCFGRYKYTTENVKHLLQDRGFKLLSTYANNSTNMRMMCENGHEITKTLANILKGHQCEICARTDRANNKLKYTLQEASAIISSEGYTLLSTNYRTKSTKLKIQCDVGHIYTSTLAQFLMGRRCRVCAGNLTLTNEKVLENITNRGYRWISGAYENHKSRLTFQCPNGHLWETQYNNFHNGCDCPECQEHGTSKIEQRIFDYVKSIYNGTVINRDRTQIFNPSTKRYLELDIWLPESMKAVEFNGRHYHKDEKVLERDEIKRQGCINKGIELLVIDEEEYVGRYNKIFPLVRQFITE